jgi:lipid-A-disaccharide synthase
MKYYVVAGEASGDLHGAKLINEIRNLDHNAEFRAWGGNLIHENNVKLDKHIKDLAFMGFTEVLANINTIRKNFKQCKKNIMDFNPDAIIFIDYPGFNLRMVKWAKMNSFKTLYFISPTIWAWHTKRVYTVKKYVDKMYVILPFEKEFYKKYDVDVEYYGNPLADTIKKYIKPEQTSFKNKYSIDLEKSIIAVLPGSRNQEVKRILPVMLSVVNNYPDYEFVIAASENVNKELYEIANEYHNITLIYNKTYDILSIADAALVTSGTATLETALFGVPQVVCYKAGRISVAIAKKLAKVDYISLVNIIMNDNIVKELIQNELNPKFLKAELDKLLSKGVEYTKIINNYDKLKEILDNKNCYICIAKDIRKTVLGL